jgi:hypothetical protein
MSSIARSAGKRSNSGGIPDPADRFHAKIMTTATDAGLRFAESVPALLLPGVAMTSMNLESPKPVPPGYGSD